MVFFNLASAAINVSSRPIVTSSPPLISYESMALSTTDLVLLLVIFIVPLLVPVLEKAKIKTPDFAPINALLTRIYSVLTVLKNNIAQTTILMIFAVVSIVYSSVTIAKRSEGAHIDDGYWGFSIGILIFYLIAIITALTYLKR